MSHKKNKAYTSGPKWNEELELPDGAYFKSHIKDYFEYISKTFG